MPGEERRTVALYLLIHSLGSLLQLIKIFKALIRGLNRMDNAIVVFELEC